MAKQIQWKWPESHGEQPFVFIPGGLHIVMAALSVLGNWLEDSAPVPDSGTLVIGLVLFSP